MNETYRAQIMAVLDAIVVDEMTRFCWFGMPIHSVSKSISDFMDSEQLPAFLIRAIQNHLYTHFYTVGGATPHTIGLERTGFRGNPDFKGRLSRANAGTGACNEGWSVEYQSETSFGVYKNGLRLKIRAKDCHFSGTASPEIGGVVSLKLPSGSHHISNGFYTAFGNSPLKHRLQTKIIRTYLNVEPDGAEALLRIATRRLNDAHHPFILKVLNNPATFNRCDSAVLYTYGDDFNDILDNDLNVILDELSPYLRTRIPALTALLRDGVGVAEDPARINSYGLDRCGVIAKAIVDAFVERETSVMGKFSIVKREFAAAGIDPELPFRDLGSSFVVDATDQDISPSRAIQFVKQPSPIDVELYLTLAIEIAHDIIETAVWHHGLCNWTASLSPISDARPDPQFGSLGPDIYDGTSGVAIFLGELFKITGDKRHRQTALGAIHHAIECCRRDKVAHHGLYVGSIGIAVTAVRLGNLLDSPELVESGLAIAAGSIPQGVGYDLMSGLSGIIIGHLVLQKFIGGQSFLDRAISTGDDLIDLARKADGGLSWDSPSSQNGQNLTGLSHGASGAGYAFFELYAATGLTRFKRAGSAAFDYERAHFNNSSQNWSDYRQVGKGQTGTLHVSCSNTWCHGAPGIAIARLHAASVHSSDCVRSDGEVALKTTRDHLGTWLHSRQGNYSLCHGFAGNADILHWAAQNDDCFCPGLNEIVTKTAEYGWRTYRGHNSWPSGISKGGWNPSLMLGSAGIANFYLRLAVPATPSPLIPHEWMREC